MKTKNTKPNEEPAVAVSSTDLLNSLRSWKECIKYLEKLRQNIVLLLGLDLGSRQNNEIESHSNKIALTPEERLEINRHPLPYFLDLIQEDESKLEFSRTKSKNLPAVRTYLSSFS